MARLEFLGGDRWKIYVDTGPPKARLRRTRRFRGPPPTATGKAPRVVQTAARKIEVELTQQRLHLAPDRVTFGQAAEAWWSWWRASEKPQQRTWLEYRRLLDEDILPALGAAQVQRITAGQLTAWYADLASKAGRGRKGEGLSAGSVLARHTIVRQVLDYCEHNGWATSNAAGKARRPKAPTTEPGLLTVEQIRALVAEAFKVNPVAGRALMCSFGLGVRRGELTALRWSSMRWDAHEVHVPTSVGDRRTSFEVKRPKSDKQRWVATEPWVEGVISEQIAAQRDVATGLGLRMVPDPWLWSRKPDGAGPPDPDYFTGVFTRARKRAGLEQFTLHDLRHAFASWLLAEGVPLTEVSGMLGHSNTAITAKIYGHADPTRRGAHEAIKRLPVLRRPVELERGQP